MIICKLASIGCGCKSVNEDGTCTVYSPAGVAQRMRNGCCVYRNIRAENTGIYSLKASKKINPLKSGKRGK